MPRHVWLLAGLALAACTATQTAVRAAPVPNYVVFFQEWSAGLDQPALQTIATAAAAAAKNPTAPVNVTGYADPLGSKQANIYLSETRAQVVIDQLTADGVAPERTHLHAAGITNYSLTSQESRRVVITIGGS